MTDEHVTKVEYEGKTIFLIATAHVSKESAALVKKVIEEERPDSVCVELDEERYQSMQNPSAWESTNLVKVIRQKKVGFLAANLFLGSYQKRIAKKLDSPVGGEMIQGIESAKAVGAQIVLADRSLQTTFLRVWRSLSLWEKMKLVVSLLFSEGGEITDQDLKELMQKDMLESVLAGVREKFPKVGEILISERDWFLASKIREAPGSKVVAVLGGAHVPGVTAEIPKARDISRIALVPPAGKASKVVGWIIPAAIMALFIYAFVGGIEAGIRQLSAWVLWTGILAAAFTALSFAHPLSILTSFVAAPFTTINPVLACGWFTGLVEASIKKPTVHDLQNVSKDISSIKGFYRNRLLRTLLVIFMANIGASIGTFIAGADIIRNLF